MSVFTKILPAIGDFLKSKGFDEVLKIGEIIPATAPAAVILEAIKNAVIGTAGSPNQRFASLSPEDQAKFLELYRAESERLKQIDDATQKAEESRLEDIANARAREIAIANSPKKDWMMWLTGVIGLLAFSFIVIASVYATIPEANKALFNILMGNVMGIALTIFTYYFGSANGSKEKDKTIAQLSKE